MKRRLVISAAVLGALSVCAQTRAAESVEAPAQVVAEARQKLDAGDAKQALSILKIAAKKWPDSEFVRTELAAAYVADNNDFWALNVLNDFDQAHPPACSARASATMILIRQADLETAEETLDKEGCRTRPEDRAREHLLRARIAQLRNNPGEASEHVVKARKQSALYDEDRGLLQNMDRTYFPGRLPWGSWRLDVGLGWTSNGLAGSPVDRANLPHSAGSAVMAVDSRVRLLWPESGTVRPAAEVSFRALQLSGETARDLSYIVPGLRPGLLFGADYPRLLLAYSFDAVRLAAIDRYANAPVWFAEGHRFEYELEATESLLAFGGGGRRVFREQGRSRWEVDQGLALGIPLGSRFRMMTGVSARWNAAENDAYDSVGGTAIAQLQVALPARFEGRLSGNFSHEKFLRSRGYFQGALDENRVDSLVRVKAGFWSPPWSGARLGLDYEYAHRASTADAYSYTDHRTLVHLAWVMDTDRLGMGTVSAAGRSSLNHGSAGLTGILDDVRVRDLMRQDEAVKQGSSCLK